MTQPRSWSELRKRVLSSEVPPVRRLRDSGGGNTVQYFDNGEERLAVFGVEPYGAVGSGSLPGLMPEADHGEDYTEFRIPEDTLSLSAITFGTGRRNALLLQETYRRVGAAVDALVRVTRVPLLEIADLAVVRPTNDILVVPPVKFGEGADDPALHAAHLSGSLQRTFGQFLFEEDVAALTASLHEGMRHDNIQG
jgi:hypothetical protein